MSRKKQERTKIYSIRLSPEELGYLESLAKKTGLRSKAQLVLKAVNEYGNKQGVSFYNYKLENFPENPNEAQHLLNLQQARIATLVASNTQLRARLGER